MLKNANFDSSLQPGAAPVGTPLALDDVLLDDAALRVLAQLQATGRARPDAGAARAVRVFRPVPPAASGGLAAALGRAAVAEATIALLGASADLSDLALHVGWQSADGAVEDADSAALAAILEYCAALGVGRGVGESIPEDAVARAARGWRVRAEPEGSKASGADCYSALDADVVESRLLLVAPEHGERGL